EVTFDANTATLTDDGDGTYTLVNANGTEVTIDVAGDVVENIQNEGTGYNEILNLIDDNATTASNGLTKDATSGDIKLGGVLTDPATVIETNLGSNTLSITGLENVDFDQIRLNEEGEINGSQGYFVIQDENGVLYKSEIDEMVEDLVFGAE